MSNKKYSSEEQRLQARRESQRRWREKNLEYDRFKYLKNRDKILTSSKEKYETIVGRAIALRNAYISTDRLKGRIGEEIPNEYVTVSDVVRLITKKCAHFDECGTYGWRKIGLNRFDNSLPHLKSNVEPCCNNCNQKIGHEYQKDLFGIMIDQIDSISGEVVCRWKSAMEAQREGGFNNAHIIQCCKGKEKKHKNYIWKYASILN